MSKKKFSPLRADRLTVRDLAGLTSETLVIVTPIVPQLGNNGTSVKNKLSNDLTLMLTNIDKSRTSPYTKPIHDINVDCDATFSDIKRIVRASSKSIMPAISDAGAVLMAFLEPFWNIDKSQTVTQFTRTEIMLNRYMKDTDAMAAAATLGLSDHFTLLNTQNTQLKTIYNQRLAEYGSSSPAATEYYADVVSDYDTLCSIVAQTLNVGLVATIELLQAFIEMDNIRKKYAALLSPKKDIHNHIQTNVPDQLFTGEFITPDSVVHFLDHGKPPIKLYRGKDYDNTYANNMKVGLARMIIHGKGKYTGREIVTFNIVSPSINVI
jgi:hypothetical protein